MGGLFAMDGKLYQFMGKLADLIILNILWVICCIPIITAGAATTAFHTMMLKLVKNEESYVFRGFFGAFRENFKQATVVYLILMAAAGVLCCDFYFSMRQGNSMGNALFVAFGVIALVVIMIASYAFPMMAFFQNSTKKVFKNSLLMAIAHFPYTILIVLINLCPWLVLLFGQILPALFFDGLIGFSLAGMLNAYLIRKIFQRYIPDENKSEME